MLCAFSFVALLGTLSLNGKFPHISPSQVDDITQLVKQHILVYQSLIVPNLFEQLLLVIVRNHTCSKSRLSQQKCTSEQWQQKKAAFPS